MAVQVVGGRGGGLCHRSRWHRSQDLSQDHTTYHALLEGAELGRDRREREAVLYSLPIFLYRMLVVLALPKKTPKKPPMLRPIRVS